MTKDEKRTWALAQYQAGDKVRDICAAIGITTPTFYRWCRTELTPRRADMWNYEETVSPTRSQAIKKAWEKRFSDPERAMRKRIGKSKELSLLEVLSRLDLSLAIDNMGHYMIHSTNSKKLYLTDTEFKALSKQPITTLKQLAVRINAAFKQTEEDNA